MFDQLCRLHSMVMLLAKATLFSSLINRRRVASLVPRCSLTTSQSTIVRTRTSRHSATFAVDSSADRRVRDIVQSTTSTYDSPNESQSDGTCHLLDLLCRQRTTPPQHRRLVSLSRSDGVRSRCRLTSLVFIVRRHVRRLRVVASRRPSTDQSVRQAARARTPTEFIDGRAARVDERMSTMPRLACRRVDTASSSTDTNRTRRRPTTEYERTPSTRASVVSRTSDTALRSTCVFKVCRTNSVDACAAN
jgi:hypothetical protein